MERLWQVAGERVKRGQKGQGQGQGGGREAHALLSVGPTASSPSPAARGPGPVHPLHAPRPPSRPPSPFTPTSQHHSPPPPSSHTHLLPIRAHGEAGGCAVAQTPHGAHTGPARHVPQPNAAVRGGGGHVVAVGVPAHEINIGLVA